MILRIIPYMSKASSLGIKHTYYANVVTVFIFLANKRMLLHNNLLLNDIEVHLHFSQLISHRSE